MFRFANPDYFYLLLLLPLLAGVFVWSAYNRRRRIERFGNPETLRALMPEASPGRYRTKFILLLAAFTLVVFALARPQTGSKRKEVKIEGIELMFAVDVSNSMLAQDFEPNRLERTKHAINRLLERLNQDRVGLVVFAGDAYVQLPITSDYMTARNFIRQVSPNMVSRQGTAIGAAIDVASSGFSSESEGSRVIILITDGENHEDNAVAAAQRAKSKGIKIYTIGIGTPEGAPIRMGDDFIRDENGNMVVTKLDEAMLKQIALLTDGAYIRSTNQSLGLTEIIDKINETERKEFSAMMFEEYNEQFQYLLGGALALLLFEWIIMTRRNRLLARFNIFKKV